MQIEHLVRVEDVERVERALDRAHRAQRARAVLPLEVRLLADADAVLAGAGAAARDGALEQTVVDGVPVGRWSGRSQTTIGESGRGLAPVTGRGLAVASEARSIAPLGACGGRPHAFGCSLREAVWWPVHEAVWWPGVSIKRRQAVPF